MPRKAMILLTLIPLLSACGGSGTAPVKSASTRPVPSRTPPHITPRPPVRHAPGPAQILAIPGLEGVIGATAPDLARQFGTPRLDVWEGDAHKLQFSGAACVLDVYLYPPAQGREPQATYLDARRTDGREVERVACVSALRKR
jgi:hypothetical protein